jgi:hypothetical protein
LTKRKGERDGKIERQTDRQTDKQEDRRQGSMNRIWEISSCALGPKVNMSDVTDDERGDGWNESVESMFMLDRLELTSSPSELSVVADRE